MSKYVVATLSSSTGWIVDSVEEALDKHFLYYFTSRRSQAKTMGPTPSFYYLISKYGDSQDKLVSALRDDLKSYLTELFPTNDVSVTVANISPKGSTYTLQVSARVVSDGIGYDLAKSVFINGSSYKLLDEHRLVN